MRRLSSPRAPLVVTDGAPSSRVRCRLWARVRCRRVVRVAVAVGASGRRRCRRGAVGVPGRRGVRHRCRGVGAPPSGCPVPYALASALADGERPAPSMARVSGIKSLSADCDRGRFMARCQARQKRRARPVRGIAVPLPLLPLFRPPCPSGSWHGDGKRRPSAVVAGVSVMDAWVHSK